MFDLRRSLLRGSQLGLGLGPFALRREQVEEALSAIFVLAPFGEEVCDMPSGIAQGEVFVTVAGNRTPLLKRTTIGLVEAIRFVLSHGFVPEGTAEDVVALRHALVF